MKKSILLSLLVFLIVESTIAQEWMTSLDIAKRLALVQNKMLFVMWEDATLDDYPVLIKDQDGSLIMVNLFDIESLNQIIWKYFVPVKIKESRYVDLFDKIKGKREENYMLKFNDDSIKIMDANGNIINTKPSDGYKLLNISSFIAKYSIDTSFIKHELISYKTQENFITSFFLGSKYIDYASIADKEVRSEIIELSNIYLDEANDYLESSDSNNKMISNQAMELLRIKQILILNKPKKALRQLRRLNDLEIDSYNQSLYAFLQYASNRLLNNIENAMKWQNEVSLTDLNKVKYLIENN